MDHTEGPVHRDIREAFRAMCRDFPGEYWVDHDTSHEVPWVFYRAVQEAD